MAIRGRKPIPANVHLLHAKPSRRAALEKVREPMPKISLGIEAASGRLSPTQCDLLAELLAALPPNTLTTADIGVAYVFVCALDDFLKARKEIEASGVMIKATRNRGRTVNP